MLYRSNLVRIPPEIGMMTSLEEFDPYTSYRLLVNACSTACIEALPTPPEDYVQTPHRGGPTVEQPPLRTCSDSPARSTRAT